MGANDSKEFVKPEFSQGEINAFVAAGESKQKDALGRIKDCLDRGLDINSRATDDGGVEFSCLLRACRSDNDGGFAIAEFLLDNGADPNVMLSKKGGCVTSAHLAVMNNSKKLLQLLLNNGYDPKLRDGLRNETALECAIRKGKTPNYNPIINDNNGITNEMIDILTAHGDQIVIIPKVREGDEDEWGTPPGTASTGHRGGSTRGSTR